MELIYSLLDIFWTLRWRIRILGFVCENLRRGYIQVADRSRVTFSEPHTSRFVESSFTLLRWPLARSLVRSLTHSIHSLVKFPPCSAPCINNAVVHPLLLEDIVCVRLLRRIQESCKITQRFRIVSQWHVSALMLMYCQAFLPCKNFLISSRRQCSWFFVVRCFS